MSRLPSTWIQVYRGVQVSVSKQKLDGKSLVACFFPGGNATWHFGFSTTDLITGSDSVQGPLQISRGECMDLPCPGCNTTTGV